MGSSAKKKKDKKKDFQKPQFKVGKTKPKASNFTDTSFKAKSIVVSRQSISVNAPSSSAQFAHHVSLLRNKSDSQRSESLAHLTTAVLAADRNGTIPEPLATLLPKLLPLILDGAPAVRRELLRLLKALSPRIDGGHAVRVLLYVHAAMTHLSADIRVFATDVLDWLLDCTEEEAVSCAGGWVKTLKCFLGLFGWQQHEPATKSKPVKSAPNGWTTYHQSTTKAVFNQKVLARQLMSFGNFLRAGIGRDEASIDILDNNRCFPVINAQQYMIPERSNAYAHLNLFGSPPDDDTQMLQDKEDRRRVFDERFRQSVVQGIGGVVKEGGDVGRTAAAVRTILSESDASYKADKAR